MEMTNQDLPEDLTPITQQELSLLGLRQLYKRTKSNLAKLKSHLAFLQECKKRGTIPKGLRISVDCNALMPELTNIKEQFYQTKNSETKFADVLLEHYQIIQSMLEEELTAITATMAQKVSAAREEERKLHEELLDKTEENIVKHTERLE